MPGLGLRPLQCPEDRRAAWQWWDSRASAYLLSQVAVGIAKAKARNGGRCCSSPTSASVKSCGTASVRPGRGAGAAEAKGTAGARVSPETSLRGRGAGLEGPGSRKIEAAPPNPVSVPELGMGGGQRTNRTAGLGGGRGRRAAPDLGRLREAEEGRAGPRVSRVHVHRLTVLGAPGLCSALPSPALGGGPSKALIRRARDPSSYLSWPRPQV